MTTLLTSEADRQLEELVEILDGLHAIDRTHQAHQLSIQSHQAIQSDLFSNTSIESISDHQILQRLETYRDLIRDRFDSSQLRLSISTQGLKRSIERSQEELQELKPSSETLHEHLIEFEDRFIDHQESLKPKPPRDRSEFPAIEPKPVLIESMLERVNWLNELKRLKLWFKLLSDFRDRSISWLDRSTSSLDSRDSITTPSISELFELVESYQHYKQLARSNRSNHLNLFDYIHRIIRQALSSRLEAVTSLVARILEIELEWPQPSRAPLDVNSSTTTRVLDGFKMAVDFQTQLKSRPDLIILSERKPEQADQNDLIWWPLLEGSILLKAILVPIILRFRFHFDGQRATNRLDKPEWYFNHILDRLVEHEKFLKIDIQKLFELSGETSIDVFHALTIQLIKLVERKLKSTIPEILEMKPILAHTIEKAIEFDRVVKQKNYLSTGSNKSPNQSNLWLGTADVILSNHQWFDAWFEAERRYFDHICLEVISSSDTWEINEDDPRPINASMTATNSALKIQDLVEQIKTKYEELPRLSYQVEFLLKIQLVVIEAYFQRINGVLDGFERKRLISVVGGESSRSKMNMGFKGLERLVKVYISCNWILSALRSWNDDLFYAELYEKLKQNKSLQTVQVVKLINSIESIGGSNVALFTPLSARFEELSTRAESVIVKQVVQEILLELKPYLSKRWDLEPDGTEEGTEPKPDEMELSNEIIQPISIWKSRINYLNQTIQPSIKCNKIIKRISKELESKLISSIILEPFTIRSITLRGALQFRFDLIFGWLNFTSTPSNAGLNRPSNGLKVEKMFVKVLDCCKLLSLPSTIDHDDQSGSRLQPVRFTELVKICFDDRSSEEEIRSLLKNRLGISSSFSRSECRSILKRRPECWQV